MPPCRKSPNARFRRPITLLEPITKLATGTVARRMSLLFHTHSLRHHHQFGFVHGGPCEAPIEVVNDMYEYAIEHDEQLHVSFLAATSAFDTVQHPALTAAFSSIGASTSFIQWIKFMVAGHRRVIRTAYSIMGDPLQLEQQSTVHSSSRALRMGMGMGRSIRIPQSQFCWRWNRRCAAVQNTPWSVG